MPDFWSGPIPQKNAWILIESLVSIKPLCENYLEIEGVSIKYLNWEQADKSCPQLEVQTTLNALQRLTKLSESGLRQAINQSLSSFLGILEDKRKVKTGPHSKNWHFVLTLWDTNLEENRKKFNHKWRQKKSGKYENIEESTFSDANTLVQEVRSRCCKAILENYSKIRLLDGTRIDVDQLYVDVYILKKPSNKSYASIPKMLESVVLRDDYERLTLGAGQKREPQQKIVSQFSKLIVLGKPGTGKTTFLRHLAVDCIKGKLFPDHIPVLIELRSIKEVSSFDLLNLIHRQFRLAEQEQTQQILDQGKAFILLDGLDEVPSKMSQSVRDYIYEFAREYYKNRFILTCRTQTFQYLADNFESIELAEFDHQQVETFAQNWFTALSETLEQGQEWTYKFLKVLEEDKQIAELAITPIMLSLICLIFTVEQKLPTKRSELYEKASDLLLQQWNELKEIPRKYLNLSMSEKKKLLSYLAIRKFEQSNNFVFFEEDEIKGYIAEYLGIEIEMGEAVLRAFEAHHGLLIERAQGIWSFSHLTFQEYFAAKWFFDQTDLQGLVKHITKKPLREVFLLLVCMLQNADCLLNLMKQQIDGLIASVEKVQQFLNWINRKSFNASYKPAAIRAFYFAISLNYRLDSSLDCQIDHNLERDYDAGFYSTRNLILDCSLMLSLSRSSFLAFSAVGNYSPNLNDDLDYARALAHSLDRAVDFSSAGSNFQQLLQQLREQIPIKTRANIKELLKQKDALFQEKFREWFQGWWKLNSRDWVERLRAGMLENRDLGYDWNFSEEEKKQLEQYYNANKLLVDCLNSGYNISLKVKEEIEETMLWPIAEIEKRKTLVSESVKEGALEAYRTFALQVTDAEIAALIQQDESIGVEFKASAWWNIPQNKKDKFNKRITETIAAFLNVEKGGTLLIGVDDDGLVIGIECDYNKKFDNRKNRDVYGNNLMSSILSACGQDCGTCIQISFGQVEGKDVCRVTVLPSSRPVFIKDGQDEYFYIRAGNSNRALNIREATDYIKNHFRP